MTTMNKQTLDPLRLRFSDEFEYTFRDDYFRNSLSQLRYGIILATIMYALFGLLDTRIFPEVVAQTWFIRYAIVCPVGVLVFFFTFSPHFKKYMQLSMFLLILIGGAGIIAMMVIVRSPVNYFHYAGLLLVMMYSYMFSKLGFYSTTLVSWVLVGLYEIAALRIMHTPLSVLLNDNLFYLSANLIGMFSSYHREFYMRKDFLQTMMIRDLEEKKHLSEKDSIFRDLHDGIGGIATSISLLAELGQKATSLAEVRQTLATISQLSRENMMEIRNIMRSFEPTPKTWQELAVELRRQGSMMIEPHGISFDIKASIRPAHDQPNKFLWLNLFRIYKEALTNIMKHSRAKAVTVALTIDHDRLALSIYDDGIGLVDGEHLTRGIANMKTRSQEIGGGMSIMSGNGTTISLELPLPIRFANLV